MKKETKRSARRDLLLILSLLCIGLLLFLTVRLTAKAGTRVTVSVDNKTVAEYPLSVDGEFSLLGGKNVLVIEGGAAYIKESLCPDHLCERQGRISHGGGRIVCLPHHLTVKIS
jgi:hypothetical protein